MAPEQARAENHEKDEKTDIYSLGAMLYNILTLSTPYDNKDMRKAIRLIASGQYTSISKDLNIPKSLVAVIERAMSLKKQERYDSVSSLKRDVQLYLDGFATKAQQAGISTNIKFFIKRHKLVVSLISLFLLVLFTVTSVFIVRLSISEKLAIETAIEAKENELEAMKLYEDYHILK